jgi:hypothetical protein
MNIFFSLEIGYDGVCMHKIFMYFMNVIRELKIARVW